MEKTIVSVAMAAVLGLALAGCSSNGMKDKIAGKYTAELTPGVTYEFKADCQFLQNADSEGCQMTATGTWNVKGDSIYMKTDVDNISVKYGEDVPEEAKAMMDEVVNAMKESGAANQAFKINSVTDSEMVLEGGGMQVTYKKTND